MSLNNSNINGHLVPETISLKESEVILTYNTDNNFYSLKENLTVIPESAEEYLDYIVTEGKDIITYDKSSGLIKIKEGVTEGFGIITIKSKFSTKVKAELKIYVTKSQTIEIFGNIYHIDKYGSLFIDGRELKEVSKVKSIKVYEYGHAITVYAITEDDRLYAWGNNYWGQVGNGESGEDEIQTTPYEVKEVGKVKSIEAYQADLDYGILTVYAITLDNRLYAWGFNWYGRVGNGESGITYQSTPYEIKEVGKVKSIKVYGDKQKLKLTFYVITEDNRLYAWGYNGSGQVGNDESGDEEEQTTPYEIKEVGKVKSIEVHYDTVYAITEDNRLYAWGNNYRGQVGNGNTNDATTPYEIKEVGKVKSIKVYEKYRRLTVYAITEDDRLYAWGSNWDGQVGNGSTKGQTTPYEVKEVGKVKSIKVGIGTVYAIIVYAITEDDRLYAWGNNYWGKVGNGSDEEQTTPYEIKEVGKVKSIEVYNDTVYAITEDDRLYAWGYKIQNTPHEFKEIGKIKSFEEKAGNFYLSTIDDRLFTWGKDGKVGNGEIPYEIKKVETYKWIKEYNGTVYAITEDDRLYAWGNNEYGQIGNGKSSITYQSIPYEIKEVGKVKSIEAYQAGLDDRILTVYVITLDDKLYAWGDNSSGQVGNSDTDFQMIPYEIKEVGKVKSVKVVYSMHDYQLIVYAITKEGKLYAWGYNIQDTPYEVKEAGKVKSIEYESGTVYVTTLDDSLYTFDSNKFSQVGNSESAYNEDQIIQYKIKAAGKVKLVKVCEYICDEYYNKKLTYYAITLDDRLYAWGNNYFGQVGNGKSGKQEEQMTPYEIKEVGKVKLIKGGFGTAFYTITLDDRLYVWGSNYFGQVGNGSTKLQTTPYELKEVGKIKSIEVYDDRTFYAITLDDRLYAWGSNYLGQVGNGKGGDEEKQTTPYEIKEVGKVKSIKVRYGTVYAITFDNRLYAWGDNEYGQVGNGKSGKYEIQSTPYEIKTVGKVKSIEVGYQTVYAITEDDRLYAWGHSYTTIPQELTDIVGKVKSVVSGYAITEEGKLYKLGTTPTELMDIVGKVKSVVYDGTTYAITEDNRLYAWGNNEYGQVGNGESGYDGYTGDWKFQAIPYEIKEVGKVKSIGVYNYYGYGSTVYVITKDNRLYAWGDNVYGQVGNGWNRYQTTPYEVKEVGKVKSIEVCEDIYKVSEYTYSGFENKSITVYAITEDDRLYAWGYNKHGQVGNGEYYLDNVTTPYEIKEVGKVKSIEYESGTIYATTLDDRLYAWGNGKSPIPHEIKEVE